MESQNALQEPQSIADELKRIRDFDQSVVQGYLTLQDVPDPALLKNCTACAKKVADWITQKTHFCIFGDYDVDGISSVGLWARFFNRIGYSNFSTYIPKRFSDGYGLNSNVRETLLSLNPQTIITVDNGTNSTDELEFYRSCGINLVVIDHHQLLAETTPYDFLINPAQADCQYPYKKLSGVGVTFLFLIELRKHLLEQGFFDPPSAKPNLASFLDLVVLGTMADQMPLTGLNRLFVAQGIARMNNSLAKRTEQYPYLRVLSTNSMFARVDSGTLSYKIIPLLNAAGRMGWGQAAYEFITATPQNAQKKFENLKACNEERKKAQKIMLDNAFEQIKTQTNTPNNYVLLDPTFHEGVTGIVANQIMSSFGKPTIVLAPTQHGYWKGSCRSPAGYSLLEPLQSLSDLLIEFGGHKQAAGVKVKEEKIAAFQQAFENYDDQQKKTVIDHHYEFAVTPALLNLRLYHAINECSPFGPGNPAPIFYVQRVDLSHPFYQSINIQKWFLNSQCCVVLFQSFPPEFKTGLWNLYGSLQLSQYKQEERLDFALNYWEPATD